MGEALITRRGGSGSDVPVYEVEAKAESDPAFLGYKVKTIRHLTKNYYMSSNIESGGFGLAISTDGGRTFTKIYQGSIYTPSYSLVWSIEPVIITDEKLFYVVVSTNTHSQIIKITNLSICEKVYENNNQGTHSTLCEETATDGTNIYYFGRETGQPSYVNACQYAFNLNTGLNAKIKEINANDDRWLPKLSKGVTDDRLYYFYYSDPSSSPMTFKRTDLNGTNEKRWAISDKVGTLKKDTGYILSESEALGVFETQTLLSKGMWIKLKEYMYCVDIVNNQINSKIKIKNPPPFDLNEEASVKRGLDIYINEKEKKFSRIEEVIINGSEYFYTYFRIMRNESECLVTNTESLPVWRKYSWSPNNKFVGNLFVVDEGGVYYLKEV